MLDSMIEIKGDCLPKLAIDIFNETAVDDDDGSLLRYKFLLYYKNIAKFNHDDPAQY